MDTLASLLAKRSVLIADGAWTTELQLRGLAIDEIPERWNLDHQDKVRAVARDYAEIPVDILTTNTFGANLMRLPGIWSEAFCSGIRISQNSILSDSMVVAALGPTVGDTVSKKEQTRILAEQLDTVKSAGASACVLETQLNVEACAIAVREARARGLEAVASFTFLRDQAGGVHTHCGTSPANAAAVVLEAGAIAAGMNCCDGPETVHAAIAEMAAAHAGVALWAKPNAGVPRDDDGCLIYPESSAIMGQWALRLADAGARIIGGCCGCGPEHITAMADALRGTTRQ